MWALHLQAVNRSFPCESRVVSQTFVLRAARVSCGRVVPGAMKELRRTLVDGLEDQRIARERWGGCAVTVRRP